MGVGSGILMPVPDPPSPSFDVLTLAAVAHEAREFVGARFAGVRQLAPDTVVLSLAQAKRVGHLLYCIHPRTARVHFSARPGATERLAPLGLLLRSRLPEAHLTAVEQPPFDRVLHLRFEALEGPLDLIAELMGRHSNLILADRRVVLGALKVVTERMSPRRPVLPGRPYLAPPADRPRPDTLDESGLRALLTGDRPVWQQLTERVLGLGPLLAREVALRAGVDPASPAENAARASGEVLAAIRTIVEIVHMDAFRPVVYEDAGRIVAFAACPMRVYEPMTAHPVAAMSEAVDRYYQNLGALDPLEDRRRALASAVRAVLRQREQALEHNRAALAESAAADRLRTMGELLLAYGSRIRRGETAVTVPGFAAGDAEVEIPLDAMLTPAENAQRLFRRYQKARAAGRALPARITRLEAEAGALREALVQIEAAGSSDDLWEVHADLAARRSLRRAPRSRPAASTGPRQFRTANGATIVAGRSARENDHVTFRLAGPDDLWFHARGMPGAHVVLKTAGGKQTAGAAPEEDVAAAAQVAAFYSEGRHAGDVAVDYVPRKHVRKMRGGPPGAVVYTGEQTTRVTPALPAPPGTAASRERAPRHGGPVTE